ncbi:hypothetical protein Ddc_03491 [Ditylenchus destructor]|nr:hypothetical protein Ddc_03491 [Ditylenchus destructor]
MFFTAIQLRGAGRAWEPFRQNPHGIAWLKKKAPKEWKPDFLLGSVVDITKIGTQRLHCALVQCKRNEIYQHTKIYYTNNFDFYAYDRERICNWGDWVLIRRCEEKDLPTSEINYFVDRVLFKNGVLIDPVTKKRVVRGITIDELELKEHLVHDIVEEPRNEGPNKFDGEMPEELLSLTKQRELQHERLQKHKKMLSYEEFFGEDDEDDRK